MLYDICYMTGKSTLGTPLPDRPDDGDVAVCANGERHAFVGDGGVWSDGPAGAVAWKRPDPVEDDRWVMGEAEADEIAREDPSLIVWL